MFVFINLKELVLIPGTELVSVYSHRVSCSRCSGVRVQDVGQVSNVPGGQSQGFNLGQFGVCGNVRDELAQLRERPVHARAAPPLRPRLSIAAARALPWTRHDPGTGTTVSGSAPGGSSCTSPEPSVRRKRRRMMRVGSCTKL